MSVDGTHIKANASKHKSVRNDRAGDLEQKLRQDIEELLLEKRGRGGKKPPEDGAGPTARATTPPPKDSPRVDFTDPDTAR